MKDLYLNRAVINHQPSPLQLSSDGVLALVTRSGYTFQFFDLVTTTELNIGTTLSNELQNLVAYDEDISVTTSIAETTVSQVRWSGSNLLVLTNNLNLLLLRRASARRTHYTCDFNINKILIDHYKIKPQNLIKFQDLLKLRIHSFAVSRSDNHNDIRYPEFVIIGLENGSIALLEMDGNAMKVIMEHIPISDKSIVNLDWSSWIDAVSFVAITLSNNSVHILKLNFNAEGIRVLDKKEILKPSKSKVVITKWQNTVLSIVMTNYIAVYSPIEESFEQTELGTFYAITDLAYYSAGTGETYIITLNGLNYLGIFKLDGTKIVDKITIDYNSANSIQTISDTNFLPLKRKLANLNDKYTNISIRGLTLDPSSKILFLGFVRNEPPIEYRRVKQLHSQVAEIALGGPLTIDEIKNFNFRKISPKYIINYLKVSKQELPWEELVDNKSQSMSIKVNKNATLKEVIEANLESNSGKLGLLQLAHQAEYYFGIKFQVDIGAHILNFISSIVIKYVDENRLKLTNKYDLAIYQSYKALHGQAIGFSTISLTFQEGRFTESFRFDSEDVSQISSLDSDIPFKRCDVTLLPMTDLNNLKSDSSNKSVINLQNLDQNEVGPLTKELLTIFSQNCIYSGDRLYKTY